MSKTFYLKRFDRLDKRVPVCCTAGDLNLMVDYDDVSHAETASLLSKVFRILNDHWNDTEYGSGLPIPVPDGLDDDENTEAWEKLSAEADEIMRSLTATG